jgi:hypothetical protein
MTALLNFPAGSAQAIVLVLLVSVLLIGYGRALRLGQSAPPAGGTA